MNKNLSNLSGSPEVAGELELVHTWWQCHRLAIQLLGGLWERSFHKVLSLSGPLGVETGGAADYTLPRSFFTPFTRSSRSAFT